MSSQKQQPQKYKNKTTFKNDKYDTSQKWTKLNKWTVSGVCARCKVTIDWKIKYKKYKIMSQPKTCVRCQQKTVTQSYCTMCRSCADRLGQCKKCGQQTNIAAKPEMSISEKDHKKEEIKSKLQCLNERQRRAYKRAVERGENPDLPDPDDSDDSDVCSDSGDELTGNVSLL